MFSIILPAYNERKNLEKCVKETMKVLKKMNIRYEIIIAEDGSTDGTDKISARLAMKYKNVRHIHNDTKLGKGKALQNSFRVCKGDTIAYIDVDMATNMKHLPELIEYSSKYDLVTGSRYVSGSKLERPLLREFVSRSYNIMVRLMTGCNIYDAQCGFKAFSRKIIRNELLKIKENTWAWDTVALVVAIKKGYSLKEFPVSWEEKKEARHSASPKRIFSDINIHGNVLLKLMIKYRLGIDLDI